MFATQKIDCNIHLETIFAIGDAFERIYKATIESLSEMDVNRMHLLVAKDVLLINACLYFL